MEKKNNNQPIRILKDFKRTKPIYYYVYKADDLDYVILSGYSYFANHIGVDHKNVIQLEDVRFSVEKEDSESFVSTLESYGIKKDIVAFNKWAARRHIDTNNKEQVEMWIESEDDELLF